MKTIFTSILYKVTIAIFLLISSKDNSFIRLFYTYVIFYENRMKMKYLYNFIK